jgi:predicted transcriptional regulator
MTTALAKLAEELIDIKEIRNQREDEIIELLKENEDLRKKTINGYIERLFNWIIKKGNE